jgi:hypothetical protein
MAAPIIKRTNKIQRFPDVKLGGVFIKVACHMNLQNLKWFLTFIRNPDLLRHAEAPTA